MVRNVIMLIMKNADIEKLKERLIQVAHLSSAMSLLGWDQEVNMPLKAVNARAETTASIGKLIHEKIIGLDSDGLLSRLKADIDSNKIKGKNACIVLDTLRHFERASKLPEAFVHELSVTTSRAQYVWAEARRNNNFALFLPLLSEIVKLKKREAEYVGYTQSPYDALLDEYEPGMTSEEAYKILNDLKDFLVPLLKRIRSSEIKISKAKIRGKFPIDKQITFNRYLAEKIGFDFDAGRMDASTHPFTTSFHPLDVRITTRYKDDDMLYGVGSTIHEAGHGLYDQGLPIEYFGTPLAESISLGIHESQSRMWENLIGKSEAFWKFFYPKIQKEFPEPFKKVSLGEFYKIINKVIPSLVRTEADEVTYNLHIIIRFEIEKEMIEGSIDLKDLPAIWAAKVKEYLGIEVPNDTLGVLQDVHWSCGGIGYFPTYSFGNLYSAQFYNALKEDIPNAEQAIARGNFEEIREWLRKNIHIHGKLYSASSLVKKVTGEELNSRYFCEYLEEKYKKIYSL